MCQARCKYLYPIVPEKRGLFFVETRWFASIMHYSPPTTVIFFDHTAKMGGGEISLLNLATNLDRRRFEPVVVLAGDGPLREKLDEAGVETHVLPLPDEVTRVRKDSLTGLKSVPWREVGGILGIYGAWGRSRGDAARIFCSPTRSKPT